MADAVHRDVEDGAAMQTAEQPSAMEAALALVFTVLSESELYCTVPLVCKTFNAAASTTYGSRPFIRNSFQVHGSGKSQSLALWLQRHSSNLLQLQLSGFKNSVTPAWWHRVLLGPFSQLQQLSLRSCGSPGLPLHLLASMKFLLCVKLEHIPSPVDASAVAALQQVTCLWMKNCQLGMQHLQAVAQLEQLVELNLEKNNFVQLTFWGDHDPSRTDSSSSSSSSSAPMYYTASSAAETASSGSSSRTAQCDTAGAAASDACSASVTKAELGAWSADAAGVWVQRLTKLQVLDLSGCRLQEGLLDQLPLLSCTLTKLRLRGTQLDATPPAAAAAVGSACTELHQLQFGDPAAHRGSHNVLALGADAAESCAVLGALQRLRELDVAFVPNACEHLCAGAQSAGGLRSLHTLNIAHTGCTNEQLQQLVECCPRLQVLDASGNAAVSSAGIATLSALTGLISADVTMCG